MAIDTDTVATVEGTPADLSHRRRALRAAGRATERGAAGRLRALQPAPLSRRRSFVDRFPHTPIPQLGLTHADVLAQLLAMKQGDQDWRGGRVFSLVYSAGDEVHELLQDALSLYSAENGLNVLAFPSIGIMQHDIVRNTATLLGADEPASGRRRGGLPDVGWHREPPPSGQDGARRGTSGSRDPVPPGRGGRERARGLHQGGGLLRRRARPGPGRRRLPRRRRRAGRCLHGLDHHGGRFGADVSPRRCRSHRRHRRSGPGAGNPLPRRCVHGWVPPSLPGRCSGAIPSRSTSAFPASRPCPPMCTSTATPPRASR